MLDGATRSWSHSIWMRDFLLVLIVISQGESGIARSPTRIQARATGGSRCAPPSHHIGLTAVHHGAGELPGLPGLDHAGQVRPAVGSHLMGARASRRRGCGAYRNRSPRRNGCQKGHHARVDGERPDEAARRHGGGSRWADEPAASKTRTGHHLTLGPGWRWRARSSRSRRRRAIIGAQAARTGSSEDIISSRTARFASSLPWSRMPRWRSNRLDRLPVECR